MQRVTISAQSHHVRQHFLDLIDLSNKRHSSLTFGLPSAAVVDYLERFSLWAGNMGAMRHPLTPLSLDQRLLHATDIRQQIHRQLDEIEEAIDDLANLIHSPSLNSSTAIDQVISSSAHVVKLSALDKISEDSLDEVEITLQIIHECINSLFRLSMLIRKLSPRDRFKQALLVSDMAFSVSFDIDYVRNKYSKLSNSLLSMRLGSAVAKRRNFIRYCRDHRSRLGMEETNIHDATDTELLSSKATTFAPPPTFNPSLQEEEEDDNFSLASASTMATSLSNLTLPTLADLAPTNQPFECPICFTIQTFKSENSWKFHAFGDLKANVCTLGGGECDAEFFEDRDSWFEHELKEHRSQYSCILCKSGGFSIVALQAHILKAHGNFSDAQIRILQEEGRENPTRYEARSCPFCDDWAEKLLQNSKSETQSLDLMQRILVSHNRFKRHVASHQEQLAIFAVPRAKEDERLSDSGSIIGSDATSTDMAMDEDERQDNAVKRESQNINDAPPDVSINPSTTSKGEILNVQVAENLVEAETSKKAHAVTAVHHSPGGAVKSPSSDPPITSNQETVPIKHERNIVLKKRYARQTGSVHIWTCCRCGMGRMLFQTTGICLETSCQHERCANCTYFVD